jgi:lysozyme
MAITNIYEQLRRDEGVQYDVYMDTEGFLTLGVGHRLRGRPLSDKAVEQILKDDLEGITAELVGAYPWAARLSPARFGALQNLAFNVGVAGVGTFKKMLTAIQGEDWEGAARELLDSKYARQVKERAVRLAKQLETSRWQ